MFGSFPNTYYNLYYITRQFSFQKVHLSLLPHHSYLRLNTEMSHHSLLIIYIKSLQPEKVTLSKHALQMVFTLYKHPLLCFLHHRSHSTPCPKCITQANQMSKSFPFSSGMPSFLSVKEIVPHTGHKQQLNNTKINK